MIDAGACEVYGFTADVVLDLLAFLDRDRARPRARSACSTSSGADGRRSDSDDAIGGIVRDGLRRGGRGVPRRPHARGRRRRRARRAARAPLPRRARARRRLRRGPARRGAPPGGRAYETVGLDFSLRQLQLGNEHVPAGDPCRATSPSSRSRTRRFDAVVSFYAMIHVPRSLHAGDLRRGPPRAPAGRVGAALPRRGRPPRGRRPGELARHARCTGATSTPRPTCAAARRRASVDDDREVPDPMGHRGHLFALVRRPSLSRRVGQVRPVARQSLATVPKSSCSSCSTSGDGSASGSMLLWKIGSLTMSCADARGAAHVEAPPRHRRGEDRVAARQQPDRALSFDRRPVRRSSRCRTTSRSSAGGPGPVVDGRGRHRRGPRAQRVGQRRTRPPVELAIVARAHTRPVVPVGDHAVAGPGVRGVSATCRSIRLASSVYRSNAPICRPCRPVRTPSGAPAVDTVRDLGSSSASAGSR